MATNRTVDIAAVHSHPDCHELKMIPSHTMNTGFYGKSDDADGVGETELVASARFPPSGWWYATVINVSTLSCEWGGPTDGRIDRYVAIGTESGKAFHFKLAVRMYCSGWCSGHGVCREAQQEGFLIGMCHCTPQVCDWLPPALRS